jgi:F-type H+-transporting ATPase subunit b
LVLSKFAFGPIAQALKDREESIAQALNSSAAAKKEVDALKLEMNNMKQDARKEREAILKEAKENADRIISEAQERAKEESNRIVSAAQEAIQAEKKAAFAEVRQQVAKIAIDIAEKLLTKELEDKDAQSKLAKSLLESMNLN